MTRISIFYPNTEGKFFDIDYYLNIHIPLSVQLQGENLKGTQVETGVAGVPEGTKPPYLVICHFQYDSIESFFSAFLPHQQKLTADMKHYTNIEPIIQISQIRIDSFKEIS